jgi:hypothetical protein
MSRGPVRAICIRKNFLTVSILMWYTRRVKLTGPLFVPDKNSFAVGEILDFVARTGRAARGLPVRRL